METKQAACGPTTSPRPEVQTAVKQRRPNDALPPPFPLTTRTLSGLVTAPLGGQPLSARPSSCMRAGSATALPPANAPQSAARYEHFPSPVPLFALQRT
jgi:hypothetical protein